MKVREIHDGFLSSQTLPQRIGSRLGAAADRQFFVDVGNVALDCGHADDQTCRHRFGGVTGGDQAQHLQLTLGEASRIGAHRVWSRWLGRSQTEQRRNLFNSSKGRRWKP